MPMNETMRTVITLLVWGSACATTDELIARGDLLAACNRRDAALLTHLANDPAGYFAARVEGELLTLEELVVAGDTRRLSGPTIPGWREVRSPARALALLGGQRPHRNQSRRGARASPLRGRCSGPSPVCCQRPASSPGATS